MNTLRFVGFIQRTLVPRLNPGSVVVMDNLRAHHTPAVREIIEANGCRMLYQPPYSPDLTSIELFWSFIKAILRRLAKRTKGELLPAIRNAMLRVRSAQLETWFRHCGYPQGK